ncbi:MAG TPA: glycosyltransferase family 39 protein [Gemmatimonadales bacterium]|nr:glycosyltransferase family 39 protein [Gemmatimonadales bacterium]
MRRAAIAVVVALAALKLVILFGTNLLTPYGFHRDELLYLAMGRHLDLWRMDFPPAIALLGQASRAAFGDWLVGVRFFPALFGTLVLVLAALIARELGGGRFAQGLAALCVLANTLFLRSSVLFQPVVLDQFAWALGCYALVLLCKSDELRWWLLLGFAAGFGLLAKFSIGLFGAAVTLAILLTPLRRSLLSGRPWAALLLALAIGSPSLVGQVRLDWPLLGQMADLREMQLARVTPADFALGMLRLGPTTLVALAGLGWLLLARAAQPFRALGWTAVVALALLMLAQGKPYYYGPMYPALYGAGAVFLGRLTAPALAPAVRWAAVLAVILYGGVLLLPLGLPILPPARMEEYTARLGLRQALRTNTGEYGRLPQDYADMLGWEEQVRAVARVYDSLPPGERQEAVIVAGNYGEAGAIDLFGPRYGLPGAVSPAGTYWFFGPGEKPGNVVVSIGVSREALLRYFGDVTAAGAVSHPYAVSEEREVPIHVSKHPRISLQELWPRLAGQH